MLNKYRYYHDNVYLITMPIKNLQIKEVMHLIYWNKPNDKILFKQGSLMTYE